MHRDGYRAEERFASLFQEVEWASWADDLHHHWDLSVGGLKIDVKAIKRVQRKNNKTDKYHWLELQNNAGRTGWLYGKADFIAFETEYAWVLVDRLVLVDHIEARIEDEYDNKFPLYKKKTRDRRKDIITLVPTSDLEKLGIIIRKDVFEQNKQSGQKTSEGTGLRPWHIIYLFIRQGKRLSDQLFSV